MEGTQREYREIAPLLWRSFRPCIHFPEKHLQSEQKQNDAAGHFKRVHVNADRVENNLAGDHGDHEADRFAHEGAAPSSAALPS